MPYLRFSRAARRNYSCARCSKEISRTSPYFRDEPHPYARMRNPQHAQSRQLCLHCVVGSAKADAIARAIAAPSFERSQLTLAFDLTPNGFLPVPPRVELVNITKELYGALARDPSAMTSMSPAAFQELIGERLDYFGYECQRVGDVNRKDGGVDFIAWPRGGLIRTFIAVQAKHKSSIGGSVGPSAVRELSGAIHAHGFAAGLLVTNTQFTVDARWVASKHPMLLQLKDMKDLQRWLLGELRIEDEWRDMPLEIEVCPGIVVKLPR